ncbi:MAG: hypothetical protein ACRD01_00900 [Terriglobales bacterium]
MLAEQQPNLTLTAVSCAEFDLLLAEVLHRDQLPPAGRIHMSDCAECTAKMDDFEVIADSVRLLANAEAEPMADLWPQIRAQLLAEGVIHENGKACRSRAMAAATPRAMPSRGRSGK